MKQKPPIDIAVLSMDDVVNAEAAVQHVNSKCGLLRDELPTPRNSYAWTDILREMQAQGFVYDAKRLHYVRH
jgi:hypothetical protein